MDGDRLSGAALLLCSLYIGYEAFQLPFGTVRQPDSGFFPLLIALALFCSSGLILLGTLRRQGVRDPLQPWDGTGRVLIVVGALVVYALVLNRLGYLVATCLIMILLLRGLEGLRWGATLGVAVPAVVASYGTFRWLGVPLPQGILPL